MTYRPQHILFAIILALTILLFLSNSKPTQPTTIHAEKKTSTPCTTEACIEIRMVDGSKAYTNDFWYLPGSCMGYVEHETGISMRTCGDFELVWIGPDAGGETLRKQI